MKIKITKTAPWQVGAGIKTFTEGQVLTVGEDVPDKIAEDMLRCDYAVKANEMPAIEIKEVAAEEEVQEVEAPKAETRKEKKRNKHKN